MGLELLILAVPILIAVIDTLTLLLISVAVVKLSPEYVDIMNAFVCYATCEFNIEPIDIDIRSPEFNWFMLREEIVIVRFDVILHVAELLYEVVEDKVILNVHAPLLVFNCDGNNIIILLFIAKALNRLNANVYVANVDTTDVSIVILKLDNTFGCTSISNEFNAINELFLLKENCNDLFPLVTSGCKKNPSFN